MTIRIVPPGVWNFPIKLGAEKVGEVSFDFFEIDHMDAAVSNPNVDPDVFLTRSKRLRAPVARALGANKRIRSALIDTGTWIKPQYAGRGYGQKAMKMFLETAGRWADIVVIYPVPIAAHSPDRPKLIEIWKRIGFVQPDGFSCTMFYMPRPLD
jgi:GNAT superfamily N-acetyltransferase